MTCTVERAPLVEAMAAIARVAGGKEFHPTWQCVRLRADRGTLCLAATDGKIWLNLSLPAKGDLEPVCVSAARLKDAVTSLYSELVGLQIDGPVLRLGAGRGKRSLPIVPTEDFPEREFEAITSLALESGKLREALAFTACHIADINDAAKAHVAGVFLFTEDARLKALGTDGIELALIDIVEMSGDVAIAVPGRVADLATLASGEVEIGISDRAIEIRWLAGRILGPLLEGHSPVDRIVAVTKNALSPAETSFGIDVEGAALAAALRGARALGDTDSISRSRAIKLTLNGTAKLSSSSVAEGSAEEEFDADLTGARDIEIGFAAARMERILRGFGDAVLRVTMTDAGTPMKFEAAGRPDRVALLFPMRI